MLAVVIPARDEAARISEVMRVALSLPASLVIPVLNGCGDLTAQVVGRFRDRRVRPLLYREALGYDVPRIAGALTALRHGARAVLFVDGDLQGHLDGCLSSLAESVRQGLDLALTDCYAETPVAHRESTARAVYEARTALNRVLGRPDLGPAIPSHGPVAVSRRLLETLPPALLGVPPLMQARACMAGLEAGIGARIAHADLGSAPREREHKQLIAETIIGDCLQGICAAEGRTVDRQGHLGYHPGRRFDLVGLTAPEALPQANRESVLVNGHEDHNPARDQQDDQKQSDH